MIRISVPLPPSSNHRLIPIRGRQIKSPAYRDWMIMAASSIAKQLPRGHEAISRDVFVLVGVIFPDKRKRDLDNVLKPLNDALVSGGAILDDSLVTWQAVCKVGTDKQAARVEALIFGAEDAGANAIQGLISALKSSMTRGAENCQI